MSHDLLVITQIEDCKQHDLISKMHPTRSITFMDFTKFVTSQILMPCKRGNELLNKEAWVKDIFNRLRSCFKTITFMRGDYNFIILNDERLISFIEYFNFNDLIINL